MTLGADKQQVLELAHRHVAPHRARSRHVRSEPASR